MFAETDPSPGGGCPAGKGEHPVARPEATRPTGSSRVRRVVSGPAPSGWYARVKRVLDVTLAILLAVPALPVILVAGLVVKLTSRGPMF